RRHSRGNLLQRISQGVRWAFPRRHEPPETGRIPPCAAEGLQEIAAAKSRNLYACFSARPRSPRSLRSGLNAQVVPWFVSRPRATEVQLRNREQFLSPFAGMSALGYESDTAGNGAFLLGKWDETWSYAGPYVDPTSALSEEETRELRKHLHALPPG